MRLKQNGSRDSTAHAVTDKAHTCAIRTAPASKRKRAPGVWTDHRRCKNPYHRCLSRPNVRHFEEPAAKVPRIAPGTWKRLTHACHTGLAGRNTGCVHAGGHGRWNYVIAQLREPPRDLPHLVAEFCQTARLTNRSVSGPNRCSGRSARTPAYIGASSMSASARISARSGDGRRATAAARNPAGSRLDPASADPLSG